MSAEKKCAEICIVAEQENGNIKLTVIGADNKAYAKISAGDMDNARLIGFTHTVPANKFGGMNIILEGDTISRIVFFDDN